jgi:hypothetical protein
MPTPQIKSFAEKTGKSVSEIEDKFKKAKAIAAGDGEKENWAYIVGIVKKMLGLNENILIEEKDSYKPPGNVAAAAKKALKYKEEHPNDTKDSGTRVGWTRANQLANREEISLNTVKRMYSFFSRHEGNEKINSKYKNEPWKDNGYLMHLAWGGDAGKKWATKIVKDLKEFNIPRFKTFLNEMSAGSYFYNTKTSTIGKQTTFEFFVNEKDNNRIYITINDKKGERTYPWILLAQHQNWIEWIYRMFAKKKLLNISANDNETDKTKKVAHVIRNYFFKNKDPYDIIIRNKLIISHNEN